VPCLMAYDPAFAYELAIIVRDGLERMYVKGEDVFYYITLYNQDYPMPAMPAGVENGILRGLYLYRGAVQQAKHRAQLLASGPTMLAALAAQEILAEKYNVAADVWSATSYGQLRSEALSCERWNRLHPGETPRVPYVTRTLESAAGPVIAANDYVKTVPDMVARWIPRPFVSLAPTATAGATPAKGCAASSRSTTPTSWSRPCRPWCSRARCRPASPPRRSRTSASGPTTRIPGSSSLAPEIRKLAPGIYFYRVDTARASRQGRFVVLR